MLILSGILVMVIGLMLRFNALLVVVAAGFVTAPAFKGKGYAREVLGYAEELLKEQFKTHIVTLGTAKEHPWLPKMYESFGFTAYDKVHFRGKQHTTILFKKELN